MVAAPARRRQGRITAPSDEDEDDEPVAATRRAARSASRPAGREGEGTRSRAAAEFAALLEATGFALQGVIATEGAAVPDVLDAVAV